MSALDTGQVDDRRVAGIPARLADRRRLFRVAAGELDLVPAVTEEPGEDGAPRPASDDDRVH